MLNLEYEMFLKVHFYAPIRVPRKNIDNVTVFLSLNSAKSTMST